ncbi:hypothetical protein FOPG_16615 [Fusarium oxysporum f. sp. conglutinans race 2 54008]|uniref:Uncharacterized protein n=1 Tax=Fusarium oxysporum f. sp. conglutinans race 2 54008 TaxID=1089457 RepID=X0H5P1_FUSOX|nr:hypothetical protein FOPG_16615 [Fusarium oxysporum f. sp. conglutinans race 2 54008]KAI8412033.1 hypothetical protein FOFC_08654 [Fusarium oxysporum]
MAEWGECDTGVMQIELEEEGGECDKCREKREEEERKAVLETILEETVNKKSDWGHCGLGRLMPDREEIGEGECTKCLKEIRELEEERKLLDTLLVDDEDLWIQQTFPKHP